jgi:hypothetical protein
MDVTVQLLGAASKAIRSLARDADQYTCILWLAQVGIRIILTMVNFWHNMGGVEW